MSVLEAEQGLMIDGEYEQLQGSKQV